MIHIILSVGSRYPVDRKAIRSCVEKKLKEHQIDDVQVSVSIVGERQMKKLHVQYMNDPSVTDVLSFPQEDPTQPDKKFPTTATERSTEITSMGDIVVCYPEAVREAAKLGRMVDQQVCFLVDHSLMHLMGFHHD